MSDQDPSKETVILVHGTWAGPVEGEHRWYQRIDGPEAEQSFVAKLDDALARYGSSARCWKHCDDQNPPFHWSGENNWLSRTSAAARLSASIHQAAQDGWKCHVIAHSHGGNILMEALSPEVGSLPQSRATAIGRLITLGTPYIDVISGIGRARRLWIVLLGIPAFLLYAAALALFSGIIWTAIRDGKFFSTHSRGDWEMSVFFCSILAVLLFVPMVWVIRYWRGRLFDLAAAVKSTPPAYQDQILMMGSASDEAWQILYHLSRTENPLRPTRPLLSYLGEFWQRVVAKKREATRLIGIASFSDSSWFVRLWVVLTYAVGASALYFWWRTRQPGFDLNKADGLTVLSIAVPFLYVLLISPIVAAYYGHTFVSTLATPIRLVWRQFSVLTLLPREVIAYLVRARAWSLLQEMALGLEAYPRRFPIVERQPGRIAGAAVRAEELNDHVVARMLSRRSEGIGKELVGITELLTRKEISLADISEVLRDIETGVSLVHAAYYTDDECIDRIARWIAGKG
jgi:hypothetical protein